MWLAISIYISIYGTISSVDDFLQGKKSLIYSTETRTLNVLYLVYPPACIYTIYYFLQYIKII